MMTEQLLQFFEANKKFYKEQIEVRKHQLAIDVALLLIQKVQKVQQNRKITKVVFMDIKGAFDHIFEV